jgi:hypothetical protein
MAKRYIDTGFLNQKWIRKLKPCYKSFVIYSMLMCDNGGIIDLDLEDAEYWIGEEIGNPQEFLPENYLVHIEGDKFWMPKFIKWQYPKFPHSKVHQQKQAILILRRYKILEKDSLNFSKSYLKFTQDLPDSRAIVNVNVNVNKGGLGGRKEKDEIDFSPLPEGSPMPESLKKKYQIKDGPRR